MLSLHITVEESRPLFPNGMVLRSSIFKKEQHLCNQTEAQPLLPALVKIPPTASGLQPWWAGGSSQAGNAALSPGTQATGGLWNEGGHLPLWPLKHVGVGLPRPHLR